MKKWSEKFLKIYRETLVPESLFQWSARGYIEKEISAQVFSCEFCRILMNSFFFYRTTPEAASVVKPYIDPCHRFFFRNLPGGRFPKQHIFMLYAFLRNKHNEFPQNTIIWTRLQKVTLQTHHVYTTLKRRGNDRFHVVSTWNIRGVFEGKDSPIFVYKCNKEENYFNLTH